MPILSEEMEWQMAITLRTDHLGKHKDAVVLSLFSLLACLNAKYSTGRFAMCDRTLTQWAQARPFFSSLIGWVATQYPRVHATSALALPFAVPHLRTLSFGGATTMENSLSVLLFQFKVLP